MAFDGRSPPDSLQALFPQVVFEPLASPWNPRGGAFANAVILAADGTDEAAVARLCGDLQASRQAAYVIVFLNTADMATTRRLIRAGAGDVLTAPIAESALAVSLERIFARVQVSERAPAGAGSVVGFMKAGGGVGATALAVQIAGLAAEGGRSVCLVDLDVQFGSVAVYMDVGASVTMADVMAATGDPSESGLSDMLAKHPSGVRVLSAPTELMALDDVTPEAVSALLDALTRDFDLVLLDLPGVWTPWSTEAVTRCDEIVLVTHPTVAHAILAQRQLQRLEAVMPAGTPVMLVCNRCGGEALVNVSARSIESAIGRRFDAIVPEDRLMADAIDQGLLITTLKRNSKLERALRTLSTQVVSVHAGKARAG